MYGAECHGVTLSPMQAKRVYDLAAAQGLTDKDIKSADSSGIVAPFLLAVIKIASSHRFGQENIQVR
ncbi:putative tocopherol C-methyltransferase [Helianthus annuus]|uniref:Tocopherol O-methyltransferase n=2 Tax=Helianthus annuus TaxID=4232 RepID=A0A251UN46_HELAN|nr:putative tocopherol O-methyltransferase [Helianthus annuus]KAJ0569443.1 putative tocopherol C-methyltransferase [Helianthus annuus]KAJ0583751.1 putative tocopherol C-methyltransferase [Helianthus annuus]KAJ0917968.1 putative tocopherol C-methyltransferase [Helianthus annuus]